MLWKIHSQTKTNACFVYGLHGQLGFKAYNAVLKYICAKMISNLCSAVQLEEHVNGGKVRWSCQELQFWGVLEGTGAPASSDALDQSDCSILAITSPFYPVLSS